jgi:hypothetical protein
MPAFQDNEEQEGRPGEGSAVQARLADCELQGVIWPGPGHAICYLHLILIMPYTECIGTNPMTLHLHGFSG